MNPTRCVRIPLQFLTLLLLIAFGSAASSTETPKTPATAAEKTSTKVQRDASDAALKPVIRFDADLDGDGIIDAIQSLGTVRRAQRDDLLSQLMVQRQKELAASSENMDSQSAEAPNAQSANGQPRNARKDRVSCLDYLLLPLEEKDAIDQRTQSIKGGVFGPGPCDPYVSDNVEHPFDSEHVGISVLPTQGLNGIANHTQDTHLIQMRVIREVKQNQKIN